MTREIILKAFEQHANGDSEMLDLLARHFNEAEAAKQLLRRKGYGCMGMGILRTAEEVPDSEID